MNNLSTQYQNNNQMQQQGGGVIGQATASREMEEVKGQILMARQFPRNIFAAEQRIIDNCKRPTLAAAAMYQYPRAGAKVSGPSIRLAEVLAQNWGNMAFGVKELEQRDGESIAMAYAWDLETNVRQERVFTVKHVRDTKNGPTKLTGQRDIYEAVQSSGSRRVRACILGIIPGDIVDNAIEQCERTLQGATDLPIKDRIASMLNYFKETYEVTQEMIEKKFGYNADSFTEIDLVNVKAIINSLKDGMSKKEDWFDLDVKKKQSSGLAESFQQENEPKPTVEPESTKEGAEQ